MPFLFLFSAYLFQLEECPLALLFSRSSGSKLYLRFCLSLVVLISSSFLKVMLSIIYRLAVLFHSVFWIYHSAPFWSCRLQCFWEYKMPQLPFYIDLQKLRIFIWLSKPLLGFNLISQRIKSRCSNLKQIYKYVCL